MTKIVMRKELTGLRPIDEQARAVLAKIKAGDMVTVEVKRPRHIKHHRKLFALLNLVVENQDHYQTVEQLLNALKCATGHADEYPMKNGGGVVMIPRSISFASLGQDEFEQVYDRFVSVICRQVIPGMDENELKAEVLSIIGGH